MSSHLPSFLYFIFILSPAVLQTNNSSLHYDRLDLNTAAIKASSTHEFKVTILPNTLVTIKTLVNSDVAFVVAQSHSFLRNLILWHRSNLSKTGSDIGVVLYPNDSSISFSLENKNNVQIETIVFVTAYDSDSPVPGGCFNTDTPSIQLDVTPDLINLSFRPALIIDANNGSCSPTSVKYTLFYSYTSEMDFSIGAYFAGLKSMVTPESMKQEGNQYFLPFLKMNSEGWINASFASYPGTGLVFGLIARTAKGSSMYVPVHTFGCNYTADPNFCYYLVNTFDRVEIVVLCVIGLILCFCGYEWESFELCVTVFILSGLVTYAALYNILPPSENVITATVSGLVLGSVMSICSALINWVHLRHITGFFNLGLLLSSVILFSSVGNSDAFKSETLFWSTLVGIAMSAFCLFYTVRSHSHRYTTAVVGSFMAVLTLDYFAGSSLKFIVFDVIRRYSVKNFISANIDPPFQTPDVVLAVMWGLVATLSVIYQLCRGQFRVGICQSPNEQTNEGCTYVDTTPLLTSTNYTNYNQY